MTMREWVMATMTEWAKKEPFDEPLPWSRGKLFYRDRIALAARKACESVAGDILEIGCYGGSTSVRLAEVARACGRRVLCIDNWPSGTSYMLREEAFPGFKKAVEPYKDVLDWADIDAHSPEGLALIRSRQWAFVFVDDGHDYADVIAELRAAMPVTNGILACDDIFVPDERKAMEDAVNEMPGWDLEFIPNTSEGWIIKKGI